MQSAESKQPDIRISERYESLESIQTAGNIIEMISNNGDVSGFIEDWLSLGIAEKGATYGCQAKICGVLFDVTMKCDGQCWFVSDLRTGAEFKAAVINFETNHQDWDASVFSLDDESIEVIPNNEPLLAAATMIAECMAENNVSIRYDRGEIRFIGSGGSDISMGESKVNGRNILSRISEIDNWVGS